MTINQMVRTCDVMVPYISDGFAVLRSGDRNAESSRFNIGQSWTLKEVQVRKSKLPTRRRMRMMTRLNDSNHRFGVILYVGVLCAAWFVHCSALWLPPGWCFSWLSG